MQAVMETLFDVVYLFTVTAIGFTMISRSKGRKQYLLFGIMAVVLGLGDAFHLVPRAYALCTTGLENHVVALGVGKFITSLTMTVFYVILYHIFLMRYNIKNYKGMTIVIYLLAALRIILCLFPQNEWLSADAPLSWAIYRNIPFAILGVIIIVLFFVQARKNNDNSFKYMWLAITLSFAFYIPVVLWADINPMIGMLMIPKTVAYVWIVWMGYSEMRKE